MPDDGRHFLKRETLSNLAEIMPPEELQQIEKRHRDFFEGLKIMASVHQRLLAARPDLHEAARDELYDEWMTCDASTRAGLSQEISKDFVDGDLSSALLVKIVKLENYTPKAILDELSLARNTDHHSQNAWTSNALTQRGLFSGNPDLIVLRTKRRYLTAIGPSETQKKSITLSLARGRQTEFKAFLEQIARAQMWLRSTDHAQEWVVEATDKPDLFAAYEDRLKKLLANDDKDFLAVLPDPRTCSPASYRRVLETFSSETASQQIKPDDDIIAELEEAIRNAPPPSRHVSAGLEEITTMMGEILPKAAEPDAANETHPTHVITATPKAAKATAPVVRNTGREALVSVATTAQVIGSLNSLGDYMRTMKHENLKARADLKSEKMAALRGQLACANREVKAAALFSGSVVARGKFGRAKINKNMRALCQRNNVSEAITKKIVRAISTNQNIDGFFKTVGMPYEQVEQLKEAMTKARRAVARMSNDMQSLTEKASKRYDEKVKRRDAILNSRAAIVTEMRNAIAREKAERTANQEKLRTVRLQQKAEATTRAETQKLTQETFVGALHADTSGYDFQSLKALGSIQFLHPSKRGIAPSKGNVVDFLEYRKSRPSVLQSFLRRDNATRRVTAGIAALFLAAGAGTFATIQTGRAGQPATAREFQPAANTATTFTPAARQPTLGMRLRDLTLKATVWVLSS